MTALAFVNASSRVRFSIMILTLNFGPVPSSKIKKINGVSLTYILQSYSVTLLHLSGFLFERVYKFKTRH